MHTSEALPERIVLFDGVCNLCSHSVQFILARDPQALFKFASLQSEPGQALLKAHQLPTENFNSLVLIERGKVYTASTGALRIGQQLKGLRWLGLLLWIPRGLRDAVYSLIARNRYRWFGKQDSCWLPTPERKARFLS
jgi:predicted DCC family thiol-disulfide oxidoreductase YuxK